jgi:hypothetical protein
MGMPMVSVIAKFDGHSIEVPDELRGAAPADVLLVYPAKANEVQTARSIWDVFGKAPEAKSAQDIDRQIRQERESWDDR